MGHYKHDLTDAEILAAAEQYPTKTAAAEALGLPRNTYTHRLKHAQDRSGITPGDSETPTKESFEVHKEGDIASIRGATKAVYDLAAVMERANLDSEEWIVTSEKCGTYQCPMKLHPGDRLEHGEDGKSHKLRGPDEPIVVDLHKFEVRLKRRIGQKDNALLEELEKWALKYRPPYKPIAYKRCRDPHLLVINFADFHLGKYSWADETGSDYDLNIAADLFREKTRDVANRARHYEIEEILLIQGNDYNHTDNRQGTTTSGTVVDSDSRYWKVVALGEKLMIEQIDYLRRIAKVKTRCVPGNHDRNTSIHIARTLEAWYRNDKSVEIDAEPMLRKYFVYGENLLGFTHHDQEKLATLPQLMADEAREHWSKTWFREWLVAHLHLKRQTMFRAGDTYGSVSIEVSRSLSATDSWHKEKGFVGAVRAGEAYVYDKRGGRVDTIASFVREN